jgi:hypothetical protein
MLIGCGRAGTVTGGVEALLNNANAAACNNNVAIAASQRSGRDETVVFNAGTRDCTTPFTRLACGVGSGE